MLHAKSSLDHVLKLTHPCRCPACENGCNFGSGAMVDGELKKVAEYLKKSEEDTKKEFFEEITRFGTTKLKPKLMREGDKPYGKCVFYEKDKGCSIHTVKPMECKIAMGCKDYGEELIIWYHLNQFLDIKNPESLRQFRDYLLSGGKTLEGAEFKDLFDEKLLKELESFDDLKDKTDWEERFGIKDKKDKKAKEDGRKKPE